GLLSRRAFLRDDGPPLSWRSTVTRLIARPLTDDGTSTAALGSLDLADPTDWSLTFAEQDTSY
ncbi:GNAT family N-acetyltransferase, partial [Halobium palmae]